jgi:catechol 2,3-dioxygenase-like lactoylglutathione lyase family enzyme
MAVSLNHTIVHARDPIATAAFVTDILGLPPARRLGHFTVVQVGETSLDYIQTDDGVTSRHFAFLVSEDEFDPIFERIRERAIAYWADPFRREPGALNHWDDGRGVYFDDPEGHLLEVITRPYGSGGLDAAHPNPLLLSTPG